MNDFVVGRFLFLRLLALCVLIAFASLLVQVDGLFGSHGILPIADAVASVRAQHGVEWSTVLDHPSLFWFGASDTTLHLACWGGVFVSILMLLGIATIPCIVIAWTLYLSFVGLGQDFLSFQWDYLLLETLALAALIAPGRIRPSLAANVSVSRIGLVPAWFLLFKLMFCSGVVKWVSDEAWRDLRALDFHFETQPLPTPLGWWAHQLPPWAKTGSCGVMFAIELALPFFIFMPRRLRLTAALGIGALMTLISITGNYTFFNLLTLALVLLLVDDKSWPAWLRMRFASDARAMPSKFRFALLPLAAASIGIGVVFVDLSFAEHAVAVPESVLPAAISAERFGLVGSYGLFRVMTKDRPEIILEGSADGLEWKTYEFPYKPGDPARAPPIVAPHQPRLDWQMWFAALGADARREPWFLRFTRRLLEGALDVERLLEVNPFAKEPPRFVRARLFDYHFTTRAERTATGAWWKRTETGEFLPAVELREGRLVLANLPGK